MFPDFRLLVGAMLASVVALSCGFGIFAAFRVSHEPLSRLPADTVALQLVTSEAVGPHPTWGAPFGSRFGAIESVNEARIGGVADAPRPIPIRRVTLEPSSPKSVQSDAAIDASHQPTASQPTALPAAEAPTEPAPTAPIASTNKAPAPSASIASAPAREAPLTSTATSPAQQASAAETPTSRDAKGDTAANTGKTAIAPVRAVATIEAPPNQARPAVPPTEITATAPEAAAPATAIPPKLESPRQMPRKAVRRPVERRRIAVRRRIIRRTRSQAAAQFGYQNSDYNNPVFQSAPGAFERQTTTSRRSDKRTSEDTSGNNTAGGSFDWGTAH